MNLKVNKRKYASRVLFLHSLDMIFDPDQDPEEKRGVRKGYRSLAKKIEGARPSHIPLLYGA